MLIAIASFAAVALPLTHEDSAEPGRRDAPSETYRNKRRLKGSDKKAPGGGHDKKALDGGLDGPRNKPASSVESALSQDRRPLQNKHMGMYLTPCLAKHGEDLPFQMKPAEALQSGSAGPMLQSDKCAVHACEDMRSTNKQKRSLLDVCDLHLTRDRCRLLSQITSRIIVTSHPSPKNFSRALARKSR